MPRHEVTRSLLKETVKELPKLAESSGERQPLKYAIVKAAGMSSTQTKETYGFYKMSTKISEVESALEDAAAIHDAIENIADIKDQAILYSLGIYDTTGEDESDSSDGSETDSDISEDEAETKNQIWLRTCLLNFQESYRVCI